MKLISKLLFSSFIFLIMGCVSAPKETVELAEIVDRQIAEMQASHEKFVSLYYTKLRNEVDIFMEQKWIPQFLSNVIEGKGAGGKKFRADLDKAYKLSTLNWKAAVKIDKIKDSETREAVLEAIKRLSTQKNAMLGVVLLDFSKGVQEQINKKRRSLIQPIDEQEHYVLDHLRHGYADLLRGSAAIKGYLSSTVKLVEGRKAVLEKIGALETQRKIVDSAVNLNKSAVKALSLAKKADEGLASFLEKMNNTKDKLEKIKKGEK
jgi:hypothetical protein